MSSFDDRRDALENKYAHDEELNYRIMARACKLFGHWAAQKMGLSGVDDDAYIKQILATDLKPESVKHKVQADIMAKAPIVTAHIVDVEFENCLKEARRQIVET